MWGKISEPLPDLLKHVSFPTKARLNLEERNSSLSEQVTRLKDENRSLEGRRGNLEQDNQRLNREYTDMFKKLSVAEASHEVSSKVTDKLHVS